MHGLSGSTGEMPTAVSVMKSQRSIEALAMPSWVPRSPIGSTPRLPCRALRRTLRVRQNSERMKHLQTARLGKTGLAVTRLGYGAMEIRGPRIWSGRPVTDGEAEHILNAVLDAGINFIDTSYDYGLSEEYIGRFISHRRDEFYLATKCGCTLVDRGSYDDTPHVWTAENLRHNIEESLRRLRTDYVDLLQLHNAPVEETVQNHLVDVLHEFQVAGKVRSIGVSTVSPHLEAYLQMNIFAAFQIPYSGLERGHEASLKAVAAADAGVIVRGGVGRGEPGIGRGDTERWALWDQAKLQELLDPEDTPTTFLLRFCLSDDAVSTVIAGTKDRDHLHQNLAAAERGALPADVYAEAKRRLSMAGEDAR